MHDKTGATKVAPYGRILVNDLLDEGLKTVHVERLGKVRVHTAFQRALAVLGKRVGAHGDAGYEVDTAENGEVALGMIEAADAHAYDLVLMDIQMPVMDGYAATRAIRALPDPLRASLPIIAVSANAFSEDRKRSLESGMDAHLPKPLDVHRLQSLIEKVVH